MMELFNGRLYPEEFIPYLQQFDKEKYEKEFKSVIDLAIEKILESSIHQVYTCCIATDIYKLETTISFDDFETSEKYRSLLFSTLEKRYLQKQQQGKLSKRDRLPNINAPHLSRNYDEPDKYAFPKIACIKNDSIPKNFEFYTQRKCWYEINPLLKKLLPYAVEKTNNLSALHPDFEIFFIGMESKEGFFYGRQITL